MLLSRSTIKVLIGVILINLLVSGLSAYHLVQGRDQSIEKARLTTRNLAHIFSEDIGGDLERIDLALQACADEFSRMKRQKRLDERELTTYLERMKKRLPDTSFIRLAYEDGQVRYGLDPGIALSIANREFFLKSKNDTESGLIISEPLVGRISGKLFVFLARRLNNPDGSFAGIVYTGYDLAGLREKFSHISLGSKGSVVLVDEGLRQITRYPYPPGSEASIGKIYTPVELRNLIESGAKSGTAKIRSLFDKTDRISSFVRIKPYPLIITVGLGFEDFLASWQQELLLFSCGSLLFLLVSGVLAWLFIRETKKRSVTQEQVRQSEETFAAAFNANPALMAINSVEGGNYVAVNEAFTVVLGYSREEVIGRNPEDLSIFQDRDTYQDMLRLLHKSGRVRNLRLTVNTKSGEVRHGLFSSTIILLHERKVVLTVMVDITVLAEAERQLVTATDAAESANRTKSAFLANMSHEIRTPMNGVLGVAQLLELTTLSVEQHEYVDMLKVSGGNLLALINEILDLTQIEAGKMSVEMTEFSLPDSIDEVVQMQKGAISEKGLSLEVAVDGKIPPLLVGDPLRIKQILYNLLGNSVKFTLQGSISVSARVLEQMDNTVLVEIEVCDTGIGISAEGLDKIFKPFVQEDSSTTRRFGGSGLGLAISSNLAELMGGRITVESSPGIGSSFKIMLPFTIPAIRRKSSIKASALWDGPRLRILIVEDNPINMKFGISLLKKLNHDVVTVENGKECLAVLELDNFDLVLMDIQMAGMNGEEVLLEIRTREKGTSRRQPVIALTAYAMQGEKERFLEEGFDGYVSKPIIIDELVAEMKRVLGGNGGDKV